MEKLKALFIKYREAIAYLFFGGVTTLVNIASYALLSRAGLSTGAANAIAWALSVLTAYFTNRRWVFDSKSAGAAAAKEFAAFVACRLGTGVLDELIMVLGVDRLGPRVVTPAHLSLWGLGVKVFSNILVIVLNYVFSKLFIFRKKEG
ncbi:MAG: GtrA family protein [Clostridia bacterium]|nr:GtrA family protein [Clostridia bacterium]